MNLPEPQGKRPTAMQVRVARGRAKLTQEQAARLVWTTGNTWKNWESVGPAGRRIPAGLLELFLIKVGDDFLLNRWFGHPTR